MFSARCHPFSAVLNNLSQCHVTVQVMGTSLVFHCYRKLLPARDKTSIFRFTCPSPLQILRTSGSPKQHRSVGQACQGRELTVACHGLKAVLRQSFWLIFVTKLQFALQLYLPLSQFPARSRLCLKI